MTPARQYFLCRAKQLLDASGEIRGLDPFRKAIGFHYSLAYLTLTWLERHGYLRVQRPGPGRRVIIRKGDQS